MGLLSKALVKATELNMFPQEIAQRLDVHFSSNTLMQGIVFEVPPGFKMNGGVENFDCMINRIIALLGSALALPSGRVLAILSDTADRELIARHLEKSISTKALAVFSAKEPAKVLEYIRPYL